MKRVMTFNPRYQEYLQYLDDHIGAVIRSWKDVLRPELDKSNDPMINNINLDKIELQIQNHDSSKYSDEEFTPYCNHWYPPDGSPVSDDEDYLYQIALVHHRNCNPHHSQHWLYIQDEGTITPLDMPTADILEMLCDWHSFSRDEKEQTAYDWWQETRDNFIMSDKTIETVDHFIEYMKTPLYEI